jgi:SAM-dependent methyltransferase
MERAARIAALGYDYAGQKMERVGDCNLCGSTHHVEAARRDRYGYPAVLRLCPNCGLGFLSPRLTAEAYADFYRGIYRPLVSAYHGRLIDARTVQQEQREYSAELVAFLEHALPNAPREILDVGGSTGVVASTVRDALGGKATVLDPAPNELEVAAAAGMETIDGFVEDYDPNERRFDLVLVCQTIDHLLDIALSLRALRSLLADGGRMFVDALDVEFAARRRGSIEGAVKADHPFYLTPWTARAYFEQAGLQPVAERMSDDGHWGFLLARGSPGQPDWEQLRREAQRVLELIWAMRARG